MKRTARTRSLGNHPAARYLWWGATIGLFVLVSRWLGPIDMNGGRNEVGKVFVIFLIPVLAAAFAFDPVIRFLDRCVYPEGQRAMEIGKAPELTKSDLRQRAERRAAKSQASRPVSSSRFTPWLYAAGVIGVMVLLFTLASFIEVRDGVSLAWVIVFGTAIAAIPAYDPIVRFLDGLFGVSDSTPS